MLKKSQPTTLLQIFSELLLYSQVILKSIRVADNTSEGISECEWVNDYFAVWKGRVKMPIDHTLMMWLLGRLVQTAPRNLHKWPPEVNNEMDLFYKGFKFMTKV